MSDELRTFAFHSLLITHHSSLLFTPSFHFFDLSAQLLDVFEESAAALGAESVRRSGRRCGPRK
jgi:hypothetical protein